MTVIQQGPEGQLNAMWTSDDFGNGYETRLGLYMFDANGDPTNNLKLAPEGLNKLRIFMERGA